MIFLPDGFKSVETCLTSCDFYYQVGKDNKTFFQRFYFFDFDTIETKGNLQGEYSTSRKIRKLKIQVQTFICCKNLMFLCSPLLLFLCLTKYKLEMTQAWKYVVYRNLSRLDKSNCWGSRHKQDDKGHQNKFIKLT